MARKPREEVEGGIHHVFARGNDRQLIYRDDSDREMYLSTLAMTVLGARWRCLVYCLMDNHVHLLIETPKANLGRGMQRLHGQYGRKFNDRHYRSGHVFQGRFGSKRMTDDVQFWTKVRYIMRNPVEAGRCRVAGAWKWSSHRGLLEGTAPSWVDVARLYEHVEPMGGDARERYLGLVDG
jgi:putative transposase